MLPDTRGLSTDDPPEGLSSRKRLTNDAERRGRGQAAQSFNPIMGALRAPPLGGEVPQRICGALVVGDPV